MSLEIHGSLLSPFVRKVVVACEEKGIAYEQEELAPFPKTPELLEKSPLGKIPFARIGDTYVPDSSVLCAYLERLQPEPALQPTDPLELARSLWLEEYADTQLAGVTTTPFFQRFVRPNLFQQEPDEAAVRSAMENDLPPLIAYLEGQLGDGEFMVGGRLSIADIAVCSPFVNMRVGGEELDAARWPGFAAYVDRVLSRPSFKTALAGLPQAP